MSRDRITGILTMVLGAGVAAYAATLPKPTAEGDAGPALFPLIAAALLLFCGLILFIRKSEQQEPFFKDSSQIMRFSLITAVYIIYGIALWAVGFLIATPVACFTLCMMMSGWNKRNWWKYLIFSLIVTAVVYYCFYIVLGLKLPVGRFIRFMI